MGRLSELINNTVLGLLIDLSVFVSFFIFVCLIVYNQMSTNSTNQIVERLRQPEPFIPTCQGPSLICTICQKSVHRNQKSFNCSQCNHKSHSKCNDISPSQYGALAATNSDALSCIACVIFNKSHIFPFTLETDEILLGLNVAELPLVDSLPTLEILSKLQNLPNLSDYDIDENIEPNINCDYLNVQEMQVLEVSPNDFKLLHLNVGSLTLHFDELFSLLGGTGINFQVIGLSEIKVSVNSPISTNINIPGYNFHHTPSLRWPIQVKHNTLIENKIHLSKTQYTYQKHNTLIKNTIHLSKTQYTYRKHNTFIENTIHLSKTQYIYRKHNTLIENTKHLSKTQYTYQKHNTFIENTIHLSKTQYTYRKRNTLIENAIHLSKTQYTYRKHNTLIGNTIHLSEIKYSF